MTWIRTVWTVARWEFMTTVRRPSFLFVLAGLPIAHMALAILLGVSTGIAISRGKPRPPIAVVDAQGQLGTMRDKDEALAALVRGGVDAVYVLDADYLRSGRADVYERPASNILQVGKAMDNRARAAAIIRRGLAGTAGNAREERLVEPLVETTAYRVDGTTITRRVAPPIVDVFAGPFGLCFIMGFSIFLASGGLQQAMATELQNRMLEVMLSVITPLQLLTGKVIGLAGAGLLQAVVYLAINMGVVPLVGGVSISWEIAAWSAGIFLAGYILFAVLMAGTGALVRDTQEVPQLASLWMLLAATPFFFILQISADASSVVARALTWVPPTAPVTLLLRLSSGEVGWLERTGAVAFVVAFAVFALVTSARLFAARVHSGGRLTLRGVLWN